MLRSILGLAVALALSGACTDDDEPAPSPARPTVEPGADPAETAEPDVAAIELPVAPTATEPLDPSPAIGVHDDALTLGGDMFRMPLEARRVPAASLEDGQVAALRSVLGLLRERAGGAPGEFRSSLPLRADREARWDTVRAAAASAAAEGFVTLKVVVRTGEGPEQRQLRVRAERDEIEPHLAAHLDPTGIAIRAPGLGAALERSCGERPEGPLRLDRDGAGWDWEALPECERNALREAVAATPSAGVTADGAVRWGRVVHLLDRLRALRERPELLALLLE